MKSRELLPAVEELLGARKAEDAWTVFTRQALRRGFPHQLYVAHRVLRGMGEHVILDGVELSSLPYPLAREIVNRKLMDHVPMRRWIVRNQGAQSFDWARRRRLAGRLDGGSWWWPQASTSRPWCSRRRRNAARS